MKKWCTGGANILTLLRFPCMLGILGCFFCTPMTIGWFWIAALLLTIGLILDWADGFYAKRIVKKPTREGKFLDPFVDKWGFTYPLFAALSYICVMRLPGEWFVLILVLFALDLDSTWEHWKDYRRTLPEGSDGKKHGAVNAGKWKFLLQSFAVCIVTASLCPPIAGEHDVLSWIWISNWIGDAGRYLTAYVQVPLAVATLCAVLSLRQRMRRARDEERLGTVLTQDKAGT